MSQLLHISDAAYRTLQEIAAQQGVSPEVIVERLINSVHVRESVFYDTEDWFRHLGATEEQIRESARLAALPETDEQPPEDDDADT